VIFRLWLTGEAVGEVNRYATSGEEVFKLFDKITPQIVLLDVKMPEINGFDICRGIKGNSSWSNVPVIFLSASNDQQHIDKAFEVGGSDYLTKPIDADILTQAVKKYLI
jgi:two-component system, sensor histidine kinase and response regulator